MAPARPAWLPAVSLALLLSASGMDWDGGLHAAGLARASAVTAAGDAVSGVQPQGIRLSAAGYMLDFRYRITDPQAAARIIRQDVEPRLVHAASGAVMRVPAPPKVGPLRHTGKDMKADKQYFILFANPAKRIKAGDEVTVVLGDQRFPGLVVR